MGWEEHLLDNLYTIIKEEPEEVIIKLSDEHHPVFIAHFPNHPILPAFIQIDIIAKIFNDDIVNIKRSKFISHILPNDIILFNIKTNNKQRKIKIFKNETKVSEIDYESK